MRYSVLIRTFNSAATLGEVIRSLRAQTVPPSQFIFVDSGSTDNCLAVVPEGSVVHRFEGEEFNYSGALNQGLPYVECDYCLVISSHTSLQNVAAVEYVLQLLEEEHSIGAAYFCLEGDGKNMTYRLINRSNFSGFNGVWNTCGVYRSSLLRKRSFRLDVRSAEDQEWSRWLFEHEGLQIARLSGGGMRYDNPRKYPLRKRLGEYLSVATFAKPDLKSWLMIARVAYRVIKPNSNLRDRHYNFVLFFQLIASRYREPRIKSRYW